jgi:hypothetical protein
LPNVSVRSEQGAVELRRGDSHAPQPVDGEWLADVAERLSGRQRGGHGGEDVAAVERPRDRLKALGRLADVDRFARPREALGGGHQKAVVGADEQTVLLDRAQRDGAPAARSGGADARTDDGEVHARRQVGQRGSQQDRPGAHIVRRDHMGEVDDPRLRAAPRDHAVAHADELVVVAVVG